MPNPVWKTEDHLNYRVRRCSFLKGTTGATGLIGATGIQPTAYTYTFTVSNPGGIQATSADLYFQEAGNRPVTVELRVTNNGISAVYNPIAQSQLAMPQFKADVLEANIKAMVGAHRRDSSN